jgi:hypothetical protein
VSEDRYCTNCRAQLPKGAQACPACGVFAGDVFDGRIPGRKRRWVTPLLLTLVLLAAAGAWWMLRERDLTGFLPRSDDSTSARRKPGPPPPPAGPVRSNAQAVRALRRYLVATTGMRDECIALMSQGRRGDSWFLTALDRCDEVRLGRWRVYATSGIIERK